MQIYNVGGNAEPISVPFGAGVFYISKEGRTGGGRDTQTNLSKEAGSTMYKYKGG